VTKPYSPMQLLRLIRGCIGDELLPKVGDVMNR